MSIPIIILKLTLESMSKEKYLRKEHLDIHILTLLMDLVYFKVI
jgi:hypothetical protein